MPQCPGMVHEPEKAQPGLKPEFPRKIHQRVIDSCEDVPEMKPALEIPLNQAGITSKTVWIDIPQGRLPFEAEVLVSLPGEFRGIHMSRMERAISGLFSRKFRDIRDYSLELCRGVLSCQRGETAIVTLKGAIPQLTLTSVSHELSVEGLEISARTEGKRGQGRMETTSFLGISLTHMTACPCTQVYNRGLFPNSDRTLMPTHSQRCMTTLEVEDKEAALSFEDIYFCLASCLHVSQDLLKRPDEAELVLKCHRQPQFAEDVVRTVAASTARRLKKLLPGDSRVRVESVSYESIHRHNVKCVLECHVEQITAPGI